MSTGPASRLTPEVLWRQAGGGTPDYDRGRYRELLIDHGHLIPLGPGERAQPLPCGWPGPPNPGDDRADRRRAGGPMSGVKFLLWSNKHSMWWRSDEYGYTADIDEAGRYTEEQAVDCVVRSAYHGDLSKVTAMVAAPPTSLRVIAGPGPLSSVLPEALARLAAERACPACYAELPEQFERFTATYCQHRCPDGAR